MTQVSLQDIYKQYDNNVQPALDRLSLDLPSGKISALLGASGSGKTTLLKIIAGLLPVTQGDVLFDGRSVLSVPTEQRGAVMVFQNHLLFPHMTIEQNIGFGLKMRGVRVTEIRRRAAEMLDLIQLPDVGKRRPHQLSGGQQQRVALARALIVEPRVLLLDEPLSNLDAHLRDEMRDLIRQVQQKFQITTIIVTHDQQDAVVLADHIALMQGGQVQQFDTPDVLFNRPASEQIARFFGGVNFWSGCYDGQQVQTDVGHLQVAGDFAAGDVMLTIRPEHVQICPDSGMNRVSGTLDSQQFMGTYWRIGVRLVADQRVTIHTTSPQAGINQPVKVYFPPEHIWLMPRSQ